MLLIQKTEDSEFAAKLIQINMISYYKTRNITWQQELFDKSWDDLENFEIISGKKKVGVVRTSKDTEAYYLRDLQIHPDHQNMGYGTRAVDWVICEAKKQGFTKVRLRVFDNNPARSLYERLGFAVTRQDPGLLQMEHSAS